MRIFAKFATMSRYICFRRCREELSLQFYAKKAEKNAEFNGKRYFAHKNEHESPNLKILTHRLSYRILGILYSQTFTTSL